MLRTAPPSRASMCGRQARVRRKAEVRLKRMHHSQETWSVSRNRSRSPMTGPDRPKGVRKSSLPRFHGQQKRTAQVLRGPGDLVRQGRVAAELVHPEAPKARAVDGVDVVVNAVSTGTQ